MKRILKFISGKLIFLIVLAFLLNGAQVVLPGNYSGMERTYAVTTPVVVDPKECTEIAAASWSPEQRAFCLKQLGADEDEIRWGKLVSMVVSIFTPIIAFLVKFIGLFMGNEIIYGNWGAADTVQKFENILHTVWLIILDLVNYIFIVVLLGIAFMSVFGAAMPENNNFEIKKLLPKFIIALIAVNFTWFGARVILDVANVTTHIVYAIPKTLFESETGATPPPKCDLIPPVVPAGQAGSAKKIIDVQHCAIAYVGILNKLTPISGAPIDPVKPNDPKATEALANIEPMKAYYDIPANQASIRLFQQSGRFAIFWEDFSWDKFNTNSIAALFAYNIFQIQNLSSAIDMTWDPRGVQVEDLIINAGFSLLFMIIIIISFVVMAIVLLERVLVIWINIILSPLAALMPFMTDFGIEAGDMSDKGIGLKSFVGYAFLPALMALPLELGFIMIYSGMQMTKGVGHVAGLDDMMGFQAPIIAKVNTFHELLWYILAAAVLWTSVEIAQKSAKFTGDFIGGITEKVKGVGSFIAKSPMYAPFIPVATPGHGDHKETLAIGDLGRITDQLMQTHKDKSATRVNKIMGKEGYEGDIKRAIDKLSATRTDEAADQIQKIMSDNSSASPEALMDAIKKSGVLKTMDYTGALNTRPELNALLTGLGTKTTHKDVGPELTRWASQNSLGGSTTPPAGGIVVGRPTADNKITVGSKDVTINVDAKGENKTIAWGEIQAEVLRATSQTEAQKVITDLRTNAGATVSGLPANSVKLNNGADFKPTP